MRTFPDAFRFALSAGISALAGKRVLYCLWELTYRCTARCAICDYWKEPSRPDQELQLPEIRRGLDRLYHHGCRAVNFTGGEPTVRRDLEAIVAHASGRGMWTSAVTNGSLLTRDRVGALKLAGLDNLLVSLDSLDPAAHDRQRGIEGSHDKVLQSVEWLSEEFLHGHRSGGIMCVLSSLNLTEIERIVEFAGSRGVYVVLQPYHENKTGNPDFTAAVTDSLVTGLVRLRRTRRNVLSSESYLQGFRSFGDRVAHLPCAAGRKYFSVDPYGYVHPCVDMPAAGHLLHDDLAVVRSPAAMTHVARCRGCWYAFRGESDTAMSVKGCYEKLCLGLSVLAHNQMRRSRGRRRKRREAG
jgi:pyrroloquinoline quinone biosynthesis protein E